MFDIINVIIVTVYKSIFIHHFRSYISIHFNLINNKLKIEYHNPFFIYNTCILFFYSRSHAFLKCLLKFQFNIKKDKLIKQPYISDKV